MIQLKNKLWGLMLIFPALSFSQTYQWQWSKQAGGISGSADPGFSYPFDESIRDIAVDNNNNTYYLATMREQGQNLNGSAVTNYGLSDLFLFSTDCQGNIRWSRAIGGSGNGENAWHIKVDNNGGVYVMATLYNAADTNDPSAVPIHFDDTHTIPPYTFTDLTTPDPGYKSAYLLKYNTSNGILAWSKPLQGDVNYLSRICDVHMMYMDSSKNIHAVLGFRAGTHLNGLINVPSSYSSSFQYYLVKFNYDNGNMTPSTPVLLPITGTLKAGATEGKVNLLYDESLNRYYLAGNRMQETTGLEDFAYNNIPFTKKAFLLAFDGTAGAELWRKEITTNITGTSLDDEIHSIIKDPTSSDIYISGRYFMIGTTPTFGNYTFPSSSYQGQTPFVMKLNSGGSVQWTKIADGITSFGGYPFVKGKLAINGNELAFAKGSWNDIWGSYSMVRPNGDKADPLLVRLNKDSGAIIGAAEVKSNYDSQDEFTAIAVDNDGNYILGGLFHDQLFTDPNDGINTMGVNVIGGKSQSFFTKYAKSACSQMSVEETAAQAGMQLYPNPVQDVLTVRSKEPLVSYEIYGATGQLIKQGPLNMTQEQIVLSSLQTGVYYIKLKTKSSTVTEKILKK
ncbi:T9SS type A sorting domain-containing protein [Chryseobacterium sp. Mn2064]|uniref:T9SS type A sorting domain-containing protein n=1 Tax=Chryseobacterium sp. Mn2064 TaxID=3395263 RepID=UPI003BCE62AE